MRRRSVSFFVSRAPPPWVHVRLLGCVGLSSNLCAFSLREISVAFFSGGYLHPLAHKSTHPRLLRRIFAPGF